MPKVSVIIPFRDRVNWLVQAVQSVLSQTHTDFEILLVDDGSDQQIPPRVIEDDRITYLRQSKRGASAARNYGISVASGKYVAFLDSDDLFIQTKLEKQVAYMDSHPAVLMTHTSYRRMTADGDDLEIMHSGEFSGRISRELIFNCHIATPTVMIRRRAFVGTAKFEESLTVGEDIVLWLIFATRSKIVGIDEPLTRVRMHGRNATFDAAGQLSSKLSIIKFIIEDNSDLARALPRWSLSSVFLDVADLYLQWDDRANYYKYLKRSLVAWPLNPLVHKALARIVASKLVAEIRRFKHSGS